MRLAPTGMPFDFPNLRPTARILDAIPLRFLLDEVGRVADQVLYFTSASGATCQAGIVLRSSCPAFPGFSQHSGPSEPDVEVRRHLANERLAALIESIQELTVASIGFVEGPGFDANAVDERAIDQVQRDLLLGLELDLVRNVVFLRRDGSLAHSWGKYKRASSRQ